MSDTILHVDDLRTYFHTRNGVVRAVDGISYSLKKGETLGIVGESGSGKSVSCYSLLRLLPCPPGRIESGRALFGEEEINLLSCPQESLRKIRGRRVAMIFQDPMTSLNPYLTIGDQLMEPLLVHEEVTGAEAKRRALKVMNEVGILDAEKRLFSYPHEFSGGMKQRVMIAMALITKPELLIADEPTTALDVTVQAQILDLIKKLQKDYGTSVIFITHDLGVIAGLVDRVLVMYGGRIVERGTTKEIFYQTKHPYTRALLDSIPATHKKGETLYTIPGMPPDVSKPIEGCSFAPRCEYAKEVCKETVPPLAGVGSDSHDSACLRLNEGILS
jgi:oligopeptide transport system ATP-binding protein